MPRKSGYPRSALLHAHEPPSASRFVLRSFLRSAGPRAPPLYQSRRPCLARHGCDDCPRRFKLR